MRKGKNFVVSTPRKPQELFTCSNPECGAVGQGAGWVTNPKAPLCPTCAVRSNRVEGRTLRIQKGSAARG